MVRVHRLSVFGYKKTFSFQRTVSFELPCTFEKTFRWEISKGIVRKNENSQKNVFKISLSGHWITRIWVHWGIASITVLFSWVSYIEMFFTKSCMIISVASYRVGARGGYCPSVGEHLKICRGGKLSIHQRIFTDNTFIHCTNYKFLLLI